jgi:hypothetical protein
MLSEPVQKNSDWREMGVPIVLGCLLLAAVISLPVAMFLFTAAPTHCFMSLKNDTGEDLMIQAELYSLKKADGSPEKLVERLAQSLKPAQARRFDVSRFEARLLFTAAGASTKWGDSRVADDLWGDETMTLHLMPGGKVQESRDFGR